MKLYRPGQVTFSGGLRCRVSPWKTALGGLILSVVFIGAAVLWWYLEAPAVVWGGCALLALFIVPMILGNVLAAFRHSNWLLVVQPDGVWINLRSYANHAMEAAETVLFLPWRNVASAAEHRDRYSVPTSDGTMTHRVRSLELRLKDVEDETIRQALAAERNQPGVTRSFFGITSRSKFKHHPVAMPQAGTLRLAWRSTQQSMSPSLKTVLLEVGRYVPVDAPIEENRADWDELTEAEVDQLVLQLAESGQTIDAVKLLTQRRGMSTTEAKQFVDELA